MPQEPKLPLPKQSARAKPPLKLPQMNPTPLNKGMLEIVRMFFKAEQVLSKPKKT